MPITCLRSLLKIGRGYAVSVPVGWVRYFGLEPKDKLLMVINDDLKISIDKPKGLKKKITSANDRAKNEHYEYFNSKSVHGKK